MGNPYKTLFSTIYNTVASSLITTKQLNLHYIPQCVYATALATWKHQTTCPHQLLKWTAFFYFMSGSFSFFISHITDNWAQVAINSVLLLHVIHMSYHINRTQKHNVKTKWLSLKQHSSHGLIQISARRLWGPTGVKLLGPWQQKGSSKTFKIILGFVIAALRKAGRLLATSHTLPTSLPVVLKSEDKLTLKTWGSRPEAVEMLKTRNGRVSQITSFP